MCCLDILLLAAVWAGETPLFCWLQLRLVAGGRVKVSQAPASRSASPAAPFSIWIDISGTSEPKGTRLGLKGLRKNFLSRLRPQKVPCRPPLSFMVLMVRPWPMLRSCSWAMEARGERGGDVAASNAVGMLAALLSYRPGEYDKCTNIPKVPVLPLLRCWSCRKADVRASLCSGTRTANWPKQRSAKGCSQVNPQKNKPKPPCSLRLPMIIPMDMHMSAAQAMAIREAKVVAETTNTRKVLRLCSGGQSLVHNNRIPCSESSPVGVGCCKSRRLSSFASPCKC